MIFGVSDLHIMPLSNFESHESRHKEGHAFLMGKIKLNFLCILKPYNTLKVKKSW